MFEAGFVHRTCWFAKKLVETKTYASTSPVGDQMLLHPSGQTVQWAAPWVALHFAVNAAFLVDFQYLEAQVVVDAVHLHF